VIERAVVLADGEVIVPADLPGRLTGSATGPVRIIGAATGPVRGVGAATGPVRRLETASGPARRSDPAIGPRTVTSEVKLLVPEAAAERQRILEALEECGGNRTRTAQRLGISVRVLALRLAEYNVPPSRRRP